MSDLKKDKVMVLKLGGQCNLHCKHCHNRRIDYEFNPDIIDYIRDGGYERVTFSGGEPLLYFDTIKKVIEELGDGFKYKLVSNGTLLTSEMTEFFNKHEVRYYVSYDGDGNDSRDEYGVIPWETVAELDINGFSVLYSDSNSDIKKLIYDIDTLIDRHKLKTSSGPRWINFPHQTDVNSNDFVTRETAKKYCQVIATFLETEFIRMKAGERGKGYPVIGGVFKRYVRKKQMRGVKCCNERLHVMTISGKFLLCPYDAKFIGDIYAGIDWDKAESYIPERCKGCELWESCMCSCVNNITDNECFISKVLHKHFYKLMDKYGFSYQDIVEAIKGQW